MSAAAVVLLGGLTGLHAATWGARKDSPFEGFSVLSFLRSVVLGGVVGAVLTVASRPVAGTHLVVLLGLLYAGERLATEWWKAFVREDDQTTYTIPMRFAVRGRTLDGRLPRYAAGGIVLVALAVALVAVPALTPPHPSVGATLLVGSLSGWCIAAGGAWKDAPVEGFSGWKFLRSPVVVTGWVLVLLPVTHDWLVVSVAAGGLSVASVETWKTYLTGGRPPGKFADRPVAFPARGPRAAALVTHSVLLQALAVGLGLGLGGGASADPTGAVTAGVAATLGLLVAASGSEPATPAVVMLGGASRDAAGSGAAVRKLDANGDLRGTFERAGGAAPPLGRGEGR